MEQLNASEAGRILVSYRRSKSVACDRCGKEFITKGRGCYCSFACRQAAYRARRKAKDEGDSQRTGLSVKGPSGAPCMRVGFMLL